MENLPKFTYGKMFFWKKSGKNLLDKFVSPSLSHGKTAFLFLSNAMSIRSTHSLFFLSVTHAFSLILRSLTLGLFLSLAPFLERLSSSPSFSYIQLPLTAKKVTFLVARPLRGGRGKGLATKKKRTFFEALKRNPKKIPPKKCGQ